jgi:AAHS family 3-hydroxyphenylpropionic acid transporter
MFGVFSLATPLAGNLASLLAIRLLAGLGLGGAMPNLIALASESVTPRRQASFVAISAATLPIGGSLASAVAAALPWRDIFEVGGLGPLALAGAMLPWLPESQRFLATRAGASAGEARPNLPQVFFGGGRAVASVMLWVSAFCALLLLFLLLNWLPMLMGAKGVSKPQASLVSLLFNVGGCLGGLTIAALYVGSKRAAILATWFGGAALSLAALAYAPGVLAAAGAAGLLAGFFISSAPTALYALAPDYYGVAMRGTGLGGVIGVGRIGAIIGPLLAGALLVGGRDARGVLMALLPFAALGAIAAFIALTRRPAVPATT